MLLPGIILIRMLSVMSVDGTDTLPDFANMPIVDETRKPMEGKEIQLSPIGLLSANKYLEY